MELITEPKRKKTKQNVEMYTVKSKELLRQLNAFVPLTFCESPKKKKIFHERNVTYWWWEWPLINYRTR